jgi:hypothetical protein
VVGVVCWYPGAVPRRAPWPGLQGRRRAVWAVRQQRELHRRPRRGAHARRATGLRRARNTSNATCSQHAGLNWLERAGAMGRAATFWAGRRSGVRGGRQQHECSQSNRLWLQRLRQGAPNRPFLYLLPLPHAGPAQTRRELCRAQPLWVSWWPSVLDGVLWHQSTLIQACVRACVRCGMYHRLLTHLQHAIKMRREGVDACFSFHQTQNFHDHTKQQTATA